MALISNIGNLIAMLPLSYMIEQVGGQNTMWILSFVTASCVLLLFCFVKDKEVNTIGQIKLKNSLKEVLYNKNSWSPMLILFTFISTSTSLYSFWGIHYLSETYQLSTLDSSKYMIFLALGFMLSSLLVSAMDRVLNRNNRLNLSIFSGIYLLIWGYIILCGGKPPIHMVPFLFTLMGIVLMFHLLSFTVIKNVNKEENAGIGTAVVNSMEFLGSSILNYMISLLVLRGIPIKSAILVYFVSVSICFVSTFFIRENNSDSESVLADISTTI